MKRNNLKGSAILCLAALIWGLAFVAQSDAADHIPPFAFNCLRSFLGAAFLFVFIWLKGLKTKENIVPKSKDERKITLIGGVICGVLLAISVNFQQAGLTVYPDGVAASARGGFLTAIYVVLVPVVAIFFIKRASIIIWGAVLVALAGTYFLCMSEGFSGIYLGDILMLCCAFCFTFHIITVDSIGGRVDGARLSFMQFVVCGIISLILSLIFENGGFAVENIVAAAPQIAYLGIMSSGVAYTLQIIGQRYAEPAVASISMSLESVFAALGGWIIAGDIMSGREFLGCALVFAAIIIAQLPEMIKKKA